METIAPQKLQPLLERQLVCKNLNIDGECLSFTAYQTSGVGLYVFKENVQRRSFFEIEILSMGKSGSLAIGLVPDGFPDNLLPGLGQNSYGYNSDGRVYTESESGIKSGDAWKVGDIIKCKIVLWRLIFTNNRKVIHGKWMNDKKYHFAVGMEGPGGEIRVTNVP
ncbi:ran-binding proteins 9/10 homolog [Ruditapes philippinarum]|uniref:ran-binding proteins 9/10 homolog n=1 Tax=Ruditapes philippinarum TaxID=129788 RepID=UPI00295BC185|nr:ran-binding proteins 9/10 homolog [Ruditapes philippinarum]